MSELAPPPEWLISVGRNLLNITQQMSMLAVVAFAMTVVLAMGDFDLSVGSMATLSGIVAAVAFRETGSVTLGVSLAVVAGVLGGALNGFLVSVIGILPFVATGGLHYRWTWSINRGPDV